MTGLADLIEAERVEHIEFLRTLMPAEWETQSLCSEWTVQEVAAHIAWAPAASPIETMKFMARSGFRVNKGNAEAARHWARQGPEAILDQLVVTAEKGLRPMGTPEAAALADAVVHAIDIRRPLGKSTALNPESFRLVAEFFAKARWPLTIMTNPRKDKGLRLVATDVEWSNGTGPEVHGRAEALLMLLTGRTVEAAEFTGPGAAQLGQ
ncbi:maleylpyruvate isomerase family mycothiol-dependent enzyme [Kibdelosporangium philippinense]|uniref:Maleylpyruvate isomerase family mycothiol-dependent enzyme n=2 Tax=Kibdelosporangium philippinense TaxID=211113 RepID=A0ABS8ZRM6_9PSEU|nr:maleylpyruvate isomerase family mycothiol-dependent enzyme [Kibdelosporangium philippinense]MCE7010395.1 maleylpyruvate isomerase family mycothiol-dependent enzyme [Kibdelosporangium philippinense]